MHRPKKRRIPVHTSFHTLSRCTGAANPVPVLKAEQNIGYRPEMENTRTEQISPPNTKHHIKPDSYRTH